MKILIVEDEQALREVLAEKFKNSKFDVATYDTGKDAIQFIEKEKPDLVLLDLVLPYQDGFSILAALKSNPKLKEIPVFVLSNLGEDENLKKALSLGAVDYMVKTQHLIGEVLEKVKRQLISKSK